MEFPDLGEHCSVSSCKQLDFLPFKCDACNQIYCKKHYFYTSHDCKEAHSKNKLVPTCPLCNEPVPCKRNETVDFAVSRHIDEECSDDRAKKKRDSVYSNKCSLRGCKQKEAIPIICDCCRRNYCLKHRHPSDHKCENAETVKTGNMASKNAASAAIERMFNSKKQVSTDDQNSAARKLQGSLSEEEALQRALRMSLSNSAQTGEARASDKIQEEEDRMLAKAIAESERDYNANKGKCYVS
ncbi:AN1-type zinc finger protein 2A-like protein [Leptotrombidium deliense]|uniref:AN1-type zinc finger protein 2A-like protein n=1 Tax=Leptotrombidium deliense TaxID=299467 RepID=A0A443S8T2_9ACAR|nr:AN1-type zinc finger protein 2A-like protein [Leptotrombidium deliense]